MHISLSLSGGGYRASAYHLGVLSYLNRLDLGNNVKLLDNVDTITGVSGGAITAMWYVCHEVDKKSRVLVFRQLYHLLDNTHIANEVLKTAFDQSMPEPKLIKALSAVYDKAFFDGKTFSFLLEGIENSHIKNFAVDATDFNSSLPFRFQATHKYNGGYPYGYIGNKNYCMPRDIAGTIKLSDIVAASSCFPVAFEPLVIDETYNEAFSTSSFIQSNGNMVLMDGGIIDNMAVDPALKARDREQAQNKDIDLFIFSDVSNEDFEKYKELKISKWDSTIMDYVVKYKRIKRCFLWGLFVLLALVITAIYFKFFICASFMSGIAVCIGLALYADKKYLKIPKPSPKISIRGIDLPLSELLNTKFSILAEAILNRLKGTILMSNDIVMMHIRRKYKDYIFNDSTLKDKVMLNMQSTLLDNGNWKNRMIRYSFLPQIMRPSQPVHNITDEACSFPTTLWFTEKDKKDLKLDKLIACGQYTTCWNLLLLIHKVENNKPSQNLKPLLSLKNQLINDWKKFCNDPLYMVSLIK